MGPKLASVFIYYMVTDSLTKSFVMNIQRHEDQTRMFTAEWVLHDGWQGNDGQWGIPVVHWQSWWCHNVCRVQNSAHHDDFRISYLMLCLCVFEEENALIEHPAVAESAVVSSQDLVQEEVAQCFLGLPSAWRIHAVWS